MKITELNFMNLAVKALITVTVLAGYFGKGHSTTSSDIRITNSSLLDRGNLLNEFYGDSFWTKGEVVSINDKEAVYEVSEIIVGKDTRARGYLVKQQMDYLYFIDVDRVNNTIKVYDFTTEEKLVFTKIDKHPDYDETYGFDFVKVISESNSQNREPQERFWGWSCGGEYTSEDMNCYRNCCYYIMWSSQGCSEYYCDKLPSEDPIVKDK